MAKIKGICKNYDECDLASEKEVQEAEKTNFICKECGKPLYALPGGGTPPSSPIKKWMAVAAAAVLLGGGTVTYFTLSDNQSQENPQGRGGEQKPDTLANPGDTLKLVSPIPVPEGAVDLGYAVWTGKMKDGKMHDTQGILTFKRAQIIDSRDDKQRVAQPGDKVIGTFENGHLVQGRWYKKDGNSESIILGSTD